jgi:diaminohydroxyphosphoribosylaminopyrimidine deaminase/5-amino-6-(5-phosphoribosylamino)uracil reductase
LVGVQTVVTDDPDLTIRLNKKFVQSSPQPIKIILDPDLRIPRDAKLIDSNTIIITQKEPEPIGEAQVISVPLIDDHFDWNALWEHVPDISSILVEGGPKTWEAFKSAHLFDEEVTLIG